MLEIPLGNSVQRIRSLSLACMLKAHQGQFAAGRQFLEQARQTAGDSAGPWHQTMLLRAEYELCTAEGRREDALHAYEKLPQYRETLGPFRWARVLTLWAEALMDHPEPDDLEQARTLLLEARTLFEGIDSQFYLEYASRMLAAAREQSRTLAAAHKNVSQELRQAGILQTSFLPQEPPQLPGWQVAAAIKPARATTGDFYDFIPLAGGKLAIVIADVADKGMGAALFMASARMLLRAYAEQCPDRPESVLDAVNRRFTQDTRGGLYMTLFYGVLDPATGQLLYCNAGHNPPFVLRPDGLRQELRRTGFPLGIFGDAAWTSASTHIEPGGLLVLYTDGITEAVNASEEIFDTSRLFQVVHASLMRMETAAHQLHAAILGAVQEFSAGTTQGDDITLVVLSRDPA
jgi:serine phosphatase RsbU (regulator of sigma subunit)